jgi:hypothetical protein
MKKKIPLTCAVTVTCHGQAIAVFPQGLATRIELHDGETATFEGEAVHIEPATILWRAN